MIHTTIGLDNVTDGIEVTWTDVKEAREYRIYRKAFGESNFVCIAVVKDKTIYVDAAVENGASYCSYVAPQVADVKAMTNVEAQMYLVAPKIEKLGNN